MENKVYVVIAMNPSRPTIEEVQVFKNKRSIYEWYIQYKNDCFKNRWDNMTEDEKAYYKSYKTFVYDNVEWDVVNDENIWIQTKEVEE